MVAPPGDVPSAEPPSSPDEPLLEELLPEELEPVLDDDDEPLPEEEDVEPPWDPELLPDDEPLAEPDDEPPPDEEEVHGPPDPLSEEPHAAPTAIPAPTTMAVESRALVFMPPLLARADECDERAHRANTRRERISFRPFGFDRSHRMGSAPCGSHHRNDVRNALRGAVM
jgi:hypothetical protein